MTLITTSSIVGMIASIAGYWCYQNDQPVPMLWTVGSFWADWWFHDFSRVPYNHIPKGDYTQDGEPFVWNFNPQAIQTTWPYSYTAGVNSVDPVPQPTTTNLPHGTTSLKKGDSKTGYTPIKGLYGVNVDDPRAIWPNDYIAKRLLGEWATASDLMEVGATHGSHTTDKMPYNTKVFTGGVSPFTAQEIGPDSPNSEEWLNMDAYSVPTTNGNYVFLPPLFETTESFSPPWNVQWPNTKEQKYYYGLDRVRSYSGGEYINPGSPQTTEKSVLPHVRPPWYMQDQYGGSSENLGSTQIGVWPGITHTAEQISSTNPEANWIMRPEFGSINENLYAYSDTPGKPTPVYAYPWGVNNPSTYANTVVDITSNGSRDYLPTEVQASYIQNMLFKINNFY